MTLACLLGLTPCGSSITDSCYDFTDNDNGSKCNLNDTFVHQVRDWMFDVSLLTIDGCVSDVRATSGDTRLCGKVFDSRMVTCFSNEFKRNHNRNISVSTRAVRRLPTACETEMSSSANLLIDVDQRYDSINLLKLFLRDMFDELRQTCSRSFL